MVGRCSRANPAQRHLSPITDEALQSALGRAAFDTVTAHTPSGGQHYVYTASGSTVHSGAHVLGQGIDIRAVGGYIVVAPSIVNGKQYIWEIGYSPRDREPLPWPAVLSARISVTHAPLNNKIPIPEGERNATLTSLAGTMRRRGCGFDEILAALSVANEKRCDPPLPVHEVEQIARSVARYKPEEVQRERKVTPNCERLNLLDPRTIRIERVEWLIENFIPFAELTMLDGNGGLGKSTVLLDLAAAYSTGARLPDGTQHEPGNVLIVAEEDRDSILRARLQVAGANLERIRFIKSVGESKRRFLLPCDAEALTECIKDWSAHFVVVDALFNHLEEHLSQNKSQGVRAALTPVAEAAHHTRAAIVGVRHWGKGTNNAAHRGLGSVDITNVCRSVLAVGEHPDDNALRVIAVAKTNLGMPCDALIYQLEPTDVQDDDGNTFSVARVGWQGSAPIRADSLAMAQTETDDECSALDDACERITEELTQGPKAARDLEHAVLKSVSMATFRRARKHLHDAGRIERRGGGVAGPVLWELAHRISLNPIESHSDTRDSIGADAILCDSAPVIEPPVLTSEALSAHGKICSTCKRIGRCFERSGGSWLCTVCDRAVTVGAA